MVERKSRAAWLPHAMLLAGVLVFAFPIYTALIGSTHDAGTIGRGDLPLYPGTFGVENYTQAWTQGSGERVKAGPVVRMMEASFYENFLEADGTAPPILDAPPPPAGGEGEALVVRSSPSGGSNDLKRLYLLALAAAKRNVDITTPYFVTDESTLWSLEDAVKRGVKIRVVMEGDLTDAMPVKYASRHMYDRLLQQGIELYEYQPTMMHTKTLMVDGIWSIFGSANFDNRSLELNDEMNLAVNSHDLARRFQDDFEADLKVSRRITLEEWRRRPFLSKVRERFWTAFGEVF